MKCLVTPIIIVKEILAKGLKMSGNNTRTTFNNVSTKSSPARSIAHHKESATI
jgi:hypothetical protein